MNNNVLKSIGAVLAGFVTVFVLSSAADFILEALHVYPSFAQQQAQGSMSNSLLFLALIYRTLFTILGGYVTAWLSPRPKMRQVVILGILGTVAGIIGVIAGWNLSAHWYPIALAILGFPSVWIGGKLYMRKVVSKNG